MSSGNSSNLLSSSNGVGSSSLKQSHKKITSHTISSNYITTNILIVVSGKQEISLTKSQGISTGARPSLLPNQTNLSKVAGVGHLSEKQNSGLAGGVLNYLQKSQNLNSSQSNNRIQKRDSAKNGNANDYYTVQNTRNPSIQNSSQQTSRNQNHLATQQLKNSNIVLNSGEQETGTPVMIQNRSMRSPPRSGPSSKPLKQINENPPNATNTSIGDFAKQIVKSGNTSSININGNPTAPSKTIGGNRHSVLTGDKQYPRATSVVKNNGLQLLQKNFSQMTNFNKSQNAKKLGQITINSNFPMPQNTNTDSSIMSNGGGSYVNNSKATHKKSMIIQQKDQYSPKLGLDLSNHTLFKSPQIARKQDNSNHVNTSQSAQNIKMNDNSQAPSVIISNSNSPMPQIQYSGNHQKIIDKDEKPNSIIESTKKNTINVEVSAQRKISGKYNKHSNGGINLSNLGNSIISNQPKPPNGNGGSILNGTINLTSTKPAASVSSIAPNGTPSCLQIDLSMLSVKPEEESQKEYNGGDKSQQTSHQSLNQTASQNAQALFSGQQQKNHQKNNQRKQTSVSQTKGYNQPKNVSQSPQIQKSISAKSPKNSKTTKTANETRQSLITGGVLGSKTNTSKLLEPIFQSQKNNTQKLQNKPVKSSTTVKSQIPFEKKNAASDRINSTEDDQPFTQVFEIKNVIINSKAKAQATHAQPKSQLIQKSNTQGIAPSQNLININLVLEATTIPETARKAKDEEQKEAKQGSKSPNAKPLEDDNFSFNSQSNKDKDNLKSQYDTGNLENVSVDQPMRLSDLNGTGDFNTQNDKIQVDHVEEEEFKVDSRLEELINEESIPLTVSEEQSNLQSHKSQTLIQQNKSLKTLNTDDKSNGHKQLSKVGSSQKIKLNLDESYEDYGKQSPTKEQFFNDYKHLLFDYEKKEIQKLSESSVYYLGILIKDRTQEDLETSRKLQTEEEMLKSLDDEEGYYNVVLNDHLNYRYEILKVLGKGSFAQVVCCLDHKTQQKVAIKITRNTELDHKFASSESKLLNFLMKNDPKDSHNVVRLINEFYFRDHHCFVFELLHTDLFEHLRENGFIGFEVSKIREYAIQILQALKFLEKHKIIHCDLKPENILLCDEECKKLKLVDYGSGCFRNEQVYTYVQSRFYRAPEVILRIPYTEKVDIWSFGCILAELYTGEPLFPGNNEQEQLELIMEICGIPQENVIDQSRKKDHYFDVDYSPFLIEDEEMGILRIPESRKLEDAVPCQDELFIDFIQQCLEIDPEIRFTASEAMKHPWIEEGLLSRNESQKSIQTVNKSMYSTNKQESSNTLQPPSNMQRRREDQQDGVKGIIYEESPVRPIKEKPKKSLTKHYNFQTVKVGGLAETDSLISTPKNEGGIGRGDDTTSSKIYDNDSNFQQLGKEQVINEEQLNKPHNISMINKNINTEKITISYNSNPPPKKQANVVNLQLDTQTDSSAQPKKPVQMIGKFELVKQDEEKQVAIETNSQTSGIATEANIPPVNQHNEGNLINSENQINKITVTFYQKRTNNSKNSQQQQTHNATQVGPSSQSSASKSPTKNSSAQDVTSKSQQNTHKRM